MIAGVFVLNGSVVAGKFRREYHIKDVSGVFRRFDAAHARLCPAKQPIYTFFGNSALIVDTKVSL